MSEPRSKSMFGSHGPSNGCVMVVEDEADVREEMQTKLKETGYEVIGVENGEKAMEAIHWGENPLAVDVIIADVDKPKSMEAVNYFRREFSTIPLIGLIGMANADKESSQSITVVLLGGGKGGSALLDLFSHLPGVQVLGILDKNSKAPALNRAQELKIPIADDLATLIGRDDVDLIVDVTGDPEMGWYIDEYKSSRTEVLGGAAAKLLWTVARHDEQVQTHALKTEKLSHLVKNGVFVNYLVKPVPTENLVQTVAKAIDRREVHGFY